MYILCYKFTKEKSKRLEHLYTGCPVKSSKFEYFNLVIIKSYKL